MKFKNNNNTTSTAYVHCLYQHKRSQWIFPTAIHTSFLPSSPHPAELLNTEETAYLGQKE